MTSIHKIISDKIILKIVFNQVKIKGNQYKYASILDKIQDVEHMSDIWCYIENNTQRLANKDKASFYTISSFLISTMLTNEEWNVLFTNGEY